MCGIVGIWNVAHSDGDDALAGRVQAMLTAMVHRGPDGVGLHAFERGAIGMRRLALVDLSARADQPMWSQDKKVAIVFNGEIYNFRSERSRLEQKGYPFRTSSDTEVLLALYLESPMTFTESLRGMYAFAIVDWRECGPRDVPKLILGRDPFGIKPLFVAEKNGQVAFASEMRSLMPSGLVSAQVSPVALHDFLSFGCVQDPAAMVVGVRQLRPGTVETFSSDQHTRHQVRVSQNSPPITPPRNYQDAKAQLRNVLNESVRLHMLADAPVGSLLSGGIDSTLVTSLARQHVGALHTFTLRYPDVAGSQDESLIARRTARRIDATHHDVAISNSDVVSRFSTYLESLDHPSTDGFNSWLVCDAIARTKTVKAVLSGLGGDEFFSGYPLSLRMLNRKTLLGRGETLLTRVTSPSLGRISKWIPRLHNLQRSVDSRRSNLDLFVQAKTVFEQPPVHVDLAVGWDPKRRLAGVYEEKASSVMTEVADTALFDAINMNTQLYMLPQLLSDSDVTSMASSLELRVPLVDRNVAQFAAALRPEWTADLSQKGGPLGRFVRGKKILREAVADLLDPAVLSAPKLGFAMPYDVWSKGALHETLFDLTSDTVVKRRGFLDPGRVAALRNSHASAHPKLWSLAVLEAWARNVIDV